MLTVEPRRGACDSCGRCSRQTTGWPCSSRRTTPAASVSASRPSRCSAEPRWQTWLRVMNAHRFNVYVSVNAMTPGRHERTKERGPRRAARLSGRRPRRTDGVAEPGGPTRPAAAVVRHPLVARPDTRALARARVLAGAASSACRSSCARELGTDPAATACSQTTRIPGFLNWKYSPPVAVTVEYRDASVVFEPSGLPDLAGTPKRPSSHRPTSRRSKTTRSARRAGAGAPLPGCGAARDRRPARRRPDVSRLLPTGARIRLDHWRCAESAGRLERTVRPPVVRGRTARQVGPRTPLWPGAHRRPAPGGA